MLQEILSHLNSAAATATALVGLIMLVVVSFFKVFTLYDRRWSRRFLEKLKDLRAAEAVEGPLSRYLDDAIFLEAYRIASGIRTNRVNADLFIQIALMGRWNRYQVQQIAKYIFILPENAQPKFKITRSQTVGAFFSLGLGVFFLATGGILALGMVLQGISADSTYAVFAGFAVELAFLLFAALIMSSYNSYSIARSFERYVKGHPEVLLDMGR